jgi:hypothetical protein
MPDPATSTDPDQTQPHLDPDRPLDSREDLEQVGMCPETVEGRHAAHLESICPNPSTACLELIVRSRCQPYHLLIGASDHVKEVAMYTPPELVSQKGHFGGADLVRQRGTVAELAQICQTWGAAIATLHTAVVRRSAAPLAVRPWVIDPEHLTASMRPMASGFGYAAVLKAYESSRDLRAAASEVDARWTELHWIHGDLTASNVLVEHRPALRVSFIDPQDVGLGDPAWDLASAVDMIVWLAPRWCAMPQPLVDYLLLGYRRAGGPGRLYPAIQAVRAMATAVWVANLTHESTGAEHTYAEPAFWLGRAQEYAARVGCLMAVA